MCEYCVRQIISSDLLLTGEQAEMISNLPHQENINNSFPFSDLDRSDCEVIFKGDLHACEECKRTLPDAIQEFFVVEKIDSSSIELI